ncbi:hypothetical protein QR680_015467 [Steinernema hermaphroditum]|uniref:Uncharacterized protein n=1 Tax=Steinernema hermaphroditum TaxID=289476 RepID=A0AA39LK95_9BILA|nr:hypothetical protein QR680_015467 [Steinernema hermaphroditum]
MLIMEILAIRSGGLAKTLGPTAGLVSIIACAFCICEYLVSQLIAFIYRYNELKINSQKMEKWKYWTGIAFLVVVPPSTWSAAGFLGHIPEDVFKDFVQQNHPEFMTLFGSVPIVGYSKEGFITFSSVPLFWTLLWILAVSWLATATIKQCRAHESLMSAHTYRLHIQLMRALAVQVLAYGYYATSGYGGPYYSASSPSPFK